MVNPESPDGPVLPYIALVVGIPAATVVAGIVTFWVAAHGADPIVTEPVVKRGLAVEDPRLHAPRREAAAPGAHTRDGKVAQ